jgi:hypothetical protein
MDEKDIFIKRIKFLIDTKENGVITRFAEKLGKKTGHINSWLKGIAMPRPEMRQKISQKS